MVGDGPDMSLCLLEPCGLQLAYNRFMPWGDKTCSGSNTRNQPCYCA